MLGKAFCNLLGFFFTWSRNILFPEQHEIGFKAAVVLKFQSICLLLCDCPKNIVITSNNLYHARYVFLGKVYTFTLGGGETKKPREIPEEFSTSTKKESTFVARNFLTRILLMCLPCSGGDHLCSSSMQKHACQTCNHLTPLFNDSLSLGHQGDNVKFPAKDL